MDYLCPAQCTPVLVSSLLELADRFRDFLFFVFFDRRSIKLWLKAADMATLIEHYSRAAIFYEHAARDCFRSDMRDEMCDFITDHLLRAGLCHLAAHPMKNEDSGKP